MGSRTRDHGEAGGGGAEGGGCTGGRGGAGTAGISCRTQGKRNHEGRCGGISRGMTRNEKGRCGGFSGMKRNHEGRGLSGMRTTEEGCGGLSGVRRITGSAWCCAVLAVAVWSVSVGLADAQAGRDSPNVDDAASGLFPVVFNLATRARISTNATCGEREPEVFCKLVEHVQIFPAENRHCDVCDSRSEQPLQRHPIANAIDGSNLWWQSPTLTNGDEYNDVIVTLDLGLIYQVAYVIIKAANSPRPGNWILERSVDGVTFLPWQYFAMTDADCLKLYGVRATIGVPISLGDDQVICTSRYSKLDPLEGGEIFVSIVNGRPGVFQPSRVLLDFTSARYVRLRLQKIRTLNADLMFFQEFSSMELDPSVTRRYFYSIKDISIGGQCICYGHATFCRRHNTLTDRFQCQCQHNTGGDNCEECLPLFNQRTWRTGGIQGLGCEACNCHGKAVQCVYNATVDQQRLSLDAEGAYSGGGVCLNCQEFTAGIQSAVCGQALLAQGRPPLGDGPWPLSGLHLPRYVNEKEYTTGVNCERCVDGYYRPRGYHPTAPSPCRPCSCRETATSTARCVTDDNHVDEGLNPGDCICKPGFGGPSCRSCAFGYFGFPNCQPCPCNPSGSLDPNACNRPCSCKTNVGGAECAQCMPGFFNLDRHHPEGCTQCFCFGVTTRCRSANWGLSQITDMDDWVLSTLQPGGLTLLARRSNGWLEAKTYLLNVQSIDVNLDPASTRYTPSKEVHYWLAPMLFLGNRMSSYGGRLKYTVKFTLDANLPDRFHLADPDIILRGGNLTIALGRQYTREDMDNMVSRPLVEEDWYHLEDRRPVSREDFMTVLYSLQQLMIKATYHTAQDSVYLRDVSLDVASPLVMSNRTLTSVEQCQCPEGYAGLSCESCAPGWRREGNQLYGGMCRRCQCYNHAAECDPYEGACQACQHNTQGVNCEQCLPGFYGDPRRGQQDDCRPCACPLVSGNNFFAESCRATPTLADRKAYECVNCREGYVGPHCDRCAPGYYGNPTEPGNMCRRCSCGGNIDPSIPGSCDAATGACNICANNTEGQFCERCRPGFFGSARNGDCRPCGCSGPGSTSSQCDPRDGRCTCRPRFVGRQCDMCQPGYGDVSQGCVRCSCSVTGSLSRDCDRTSGRCRCRAGVGGDTCDRCADGHFGFSQRGCQRCDCHAAGTNQANQCDPRSGRCLCQPNVVGQRCDQCQVGFYDLASGTGCAECACDGVGATSRECDPRDGRCPCRPGVGGRACDQCQPGYFGFSAGGCRQCEPCSKPGHICDPDTGECVCPPNTRGPRCERCKDDAYNYDSLKGCKRCNCTQEGSRSQQCDPVSGACGCRAGYSGFSCESCLPGHHGFPQCQACLCNARGAKPESCSHGPDLCQCDDSRQCMCKLNVQGAQCDTCAPGSFSLQEVNPKGCTECHCFFRAQECSQANYVWTTVTVDTRRATITPQAEQPAVVIGRYLVINSSHVSVAPELQDRALYWAMPPELLGDKTVSYNGRLDFIHYFDGPGGSSSGSQSVSPLVVLVGNGFELHGDVTALEPNHAETFSVNVHENYWRLPGQQPPVSRRLLMVVLQNVTSILVRATQDGHATYAEIGPIGMEVAVPSQGGGGGDAVAYGVEQCTCPERYSGLSCQNPAEGYHRVRPDPGTNLQTPENAIGHVRPCQCYTHSNVCHPETGVCTDCQHNTTGDHCDLCGPGFYGIATRGSPHDCAPCACPLSEPSNNPTCSGVGNNLMCTSCNEGHIGSRCERCEYGFYGNPLEVGGRCQRCNCAVEGSLDDRCDPLTGQCRCRAGIEGRRCDGCQDPQQGVHDGHCVSCYEGCTGELLQDLQNLTIPSALINVTGVIYPWEQVYRIANETKKLRERLDALQSTSLDGLKDKEKEAGFYTDIADNLHKRALSVCGNEANFTNSRVGMVAMKANATRHNATDTERLVDELFKEIKGNISQLRQLVEKLYYNQTGLNVSAALKEAQDILASILNRNFVDADDKSKGEIIPLLEAKARSEITLAEKLSDRIKTLQGRLTNPTAVAETLAEIQSALDDLRNQSQQAKVKALEVIDEQTQKLGTIIADLEDKLLDLEDMKGTTTDLLKEGEDLITEAEEALGRLRDNIKAVERQLYSLDAATDELERRLGAVRTAMPGLEQQYQDAWKHAMELEKSATQLENLFDKVRTLAEDPLRAAQAYESIVQSITQAEESARRALKTAQDTVDIAMLDDLQNEVQRSIARSRDLLNQADNLLSQSVTELADKLDGVKTEAKEAEQKHKSAEDLLALVVDGLDTMPQGFGGRLDDILRKANQALQQADAANKTVSDIQRQIDNDLPKLKQLQDFDINAIILNVEKNAEDARKSAQYVSSNVPLSKTKGQENMRAAVSISENLSNLRRKIDEARNTTNSMKMSLSGEGNCARSYRSQLSRGVTNEIRLGVKINRTDTDMMLLLLQESAQEYLALEVKANQVRFSWDVGRGPGSVTHDLKLQVFSPTTEEQQKWYRVLAKRVGPIGQLKVWPMTGSEGEAKEVSGKSQSGFSLINFNGGTSVYMAGAGAGHTVPPGVTRGKLHGCMGDVTLDSKPVGVYNFQTNEGDCKACKNVPVQLPSFKVYSFDGNGYAIQPINGYTSKIMVIQLEFKTFWGDSRLFFAGNSQFGDFVSIDLVGGKIMVEIYLGGMTRAKVVSKMNYNTNQWTSIILFRNGLEALLTTDVDSQAAEKLSFAATGPNTGLEIAGQSMYIGGLPNNFNINDFTKEVKDNRNFLGCMRYIGFGKYNPQPLDIFNGVQVGIKAGCKDSGIRQVGFYGDGYVMFDGVSLGKEEADISLSFFTKQADSLLLLGKDVATDYFYSLALTGGRVEARLAANSPQTVLVSPDTYNDGAVHYVALLKDGRRIQMLVDDVAVAEADLDVDDIPMGVNSNLYFGGASISVGDMAASSVYLDGCISDIIANGRLLELNQAKQYSKADIGRCRDSVTFANGDTPALCENVKSDPNSGSSVFPILPRLVAATTAILAPANSSTTPAAATTMAPETSTCSPFRLMNAGIEDNAKTLGNSASSYAEISQGVRKGEISKNFNITFEFRTFYGDGLFGLLINADQSVFFAAQLRGGAAEVVFTFKGAERRITSTQQLADGQWHSGQIIKDRTAIRLEVDGQLVGTERIESRLKIDLPLYIGGLPTKDTILVDIVKHSLRGCVRNFHLGGRAVDITSTTIISGVEHCYAQVEPGVGFTSDSFGIYALEFDVADSLVVEVDFKTSRREGVILTISDIGGNVGVTLEVHDGKVMFAHTNGGQTVRAESENLDPNEFCRNQWHTLRATLSDNYLRLGVDSMGDVVVLRPFPALATPVRQPLIIGGYPSTFDQQAASLSKTGFYGCMRNVVINGQQVDWYNLQMTGSLLRTACPL